VKGGPWRGTGCRFSAAVAAGMANGEKLGAAVRLAKEFVISEIGNSE
jgi:hydroxymethylpyrimidine/phosphomethylpyrimidine kinase